MNIDAYTDGSFSVVTNDMGVGVVVFVDDKFHSSISLYVKKGPDGNSANYAEYAAVKELFRMIELLPESTVTIHSDSKLVVNQMKGYWRVGNGAYASMAKEVRDLYRKCKHKVIFKWIPRKQNDQADTLSKEARVHQSRIVVVGTGAALFGTF